MKLKPMNKLNKKEFKARMGDSFPSVYLTMISIIQGVALGILASQINRLIFHPEQGSTMIRHWLLVAPYCIFSFMSILIVAYQYSWFIGLFKWSPAFWDIFFPFSLGLTEILPMFFLNKPAGWMLCTSVFSFMGVLAWRNTLIHCNSSAFGQKKKAMVRTIKLLILNIKIALMAGFSLGIPAVFIVLLSPDYAKKPKSNFLWFEIFVLIFPVSALFLIKKGERFMNMIHGDFGYNFDAPEKYEINFFVLLFRKSF